MTPAGPPVRPPSIGVGVERAHMKKLLLLLILVAIGVAVARKIREDA